MPPVDKKICYTPWLVRGNYHCKFHRGLFIFFIIRLGSEKYGGFYFSSDRKKRKYFLSANMFFCFSLSKRYCRHMPCPSIGPNCFGCVQIGLNRSKMFWTRPKTTFHHWISHFEPFPVQNNLDGSKIVLDSQKDKT